jgi:glutaminase
MYAQLPDDALSSRISTGHLPPADEIEALVRQAYARHEDLDEGKVADYIPALAKVPRALFGIYATGLPFTSAMAVGVTR